MELDGGTMATDRDVCYAHTNLVANSGEVEHAVNDARRSRGEWPLPGQNNRFLAQAEFSCDIPPAPKELWSYDLGRTQLGAAFRADVDSRPEFLASLAAFKPIDQCHGRVLCRCSI